MKSRLSKSSISSNVISKVANLLDSRESVFFVKLSNFFLETPSTGSPMNPVTLTLRISPEQTRSEYFAPLSHSKSEHNYLEISISKPFVCTSVPSLSKFFVGSK